MPCSEKLPSFDLNDAPSSAAAHRCSRPSPGTPVAACPNPRYRRPWDKDPATFIGRTAFVRVDGCTLRTHRDLKRKLRCANRFSNRFERNEGRVGLQRWKAPTVVAIPVTCSPPSCGRHEFGVLSRECAQQFKASIRDRCSNRLHDLDYIFTQKLNDERNNPWSIISEELPQAILANVAIPMPGADAKREHSSVLTRAGDDRLKVSRRVVDAVRNGQPLALHEDGEPVRCWCKLPCGKRK
ncbi:hypothetical protein D3C87_358540 [compost metagenome]